MARQSENSAANTYKSPGLKALEPYKWKKGIKSPNPTGRGLKLSNEIRDITGGGIEMVHAMVRLMRGEKFPGYKYPPKYETVLESAKWLAEQVWGKAPMKLIDSNGEQVDLIKMLYVELTKKPDTGVFDLKEAHVIDAEVDGERPPAA